MITKDRTYRNFEIRASQEANIIEGYAVVFDAITTLYSMGGIDYKECIKRSSFDSTELQDVVLVINHEGRPIARTKNGTLSLLVDQRGLKIRADLSGTEEGRKTFEEVKGGFFDSMSFSFITDSEEYDKSTHVRSITGIKRLFDVSLVNFAAYEQTNVSARSYFIGAAETELKEKIKIAKAKFEFMR